MSKAPEMIQQRIECRKAQLNLWEIEESVRNLDEESQALAGFLFASLPVSDLAEYNFETFREDLIHSSFLRRQVDWCRDLPEDIFLHYVFFPRINTEGLEPCRHFFYQQLSPRIQNLTLEQAVLEVNYWCAEHVTYQASDDRTLSAMAVFRAGRGRCGEESVFTVAALRSVGIAARQVYAPWWSHCDDNHAWVEVYLNGTWHYLGACEPEEVLDRGWFTYAASRAMLVQSRTFGDLPVAGESTIGREGCVHTYNSTCRYGETVNLEISVRDREGNPRPNQKVLLSVCNMASFRALTTLETDQEGRTEIQVGKGSLLLEAKQGPLCARQLIHTAQEQQVTLILEEKRERDNQERFTFYAPKDGGRKPGAVTENQAKIRRERLIEAGRLRGLYKKTEWPQNPLLNQLTDKDQYDFPLQLQEQFQIENTQKLPIGLFEPYVLNPRVDEEQLAPMQGPLKKWESGKLLTGSEGFEPARALQQVSQYIDCREEEDYMALQPSVAALCRLGRTSLQGRERFLISLCRNHQIPARRNPVTRRPEYWNDGWYGFREEERRTGTLRLATEEAIKFQEGIDYSLSYLDENGTRLLCVGQDICKENQIELTLPPGNYQIMTTVRRANGNQNVIRTTFYVEAFQTKRIWLTRERVNAKEELVSYQLPDVALNYGGETVHLSEIVRQTELLVVAEPDAEPTIHVLNELKQSQMPAAVTTGNGEALARRMYVDPDRLPLLIVVEPGLFGRYACVGYQVGSVAFCQKIIETLKELEVLVP